MSWNQKVQETLHMLKAWQAQEKSVYESRGILCHLLENHLTNILEVQESLEKSGEESVCIFILLWILGTIQANQEIFFNHKSVSPNTDTELSQKDGQEESLSNAFTVWTIAKLAKLLGYPECKILHDTCLSVICSLLDIIKWKDMHLYSRLCSDVVLSLNDLVEANEEILKDEEYDNDIIIHRFQTEHNQVLLSLSEPEKRLGSSPKNISVVAIRIPNADSCENYQINLTKLLLKINGDIGIVCHRVLPSLWKSLCWAMELGDLELKDTSMQVISCLLKNGWLQVKVVDYFFGCVTALVDLMCSGCCGAAVEQREPVEKALAGVLFSMIETDSTKQHEVHFSIANIQDALESLLRILKKHTLKLLATQSLQQAVSDMLCHCVQRLGDQLSLNVLLTPLKDSLFVTLLNHCGSMGDIQFVVAPLVHIIRNEVNLIESTQEYSPEKQMAFSSMKLGNKRKADTFHLKKCKQQKMVLERLKTLISDLTSEGQEKKILYTTEGIRVCMEVLLCCLNACRTHQYSAEKDYTTSDQNAICDLSLKSLQALTPYIAECHRRTELTYWIPNNVFSSLVKAVFISWNKASQWSQGSINEILLCVVNLFSSVLSQYQIGDFETETLMNICTLASFPWLLNDLSWMDLKPSDAKEAVNISQAVNDKLEVKVKIECLEMLSLFPKDVAQKWRFHVFRQAVGDSDVQIQKATMKSFPMLLHLSGPNANHLVYDLIHPLMQNPSTELHEVIAEICGIITCIVCRRTSIRQEMVSYNKPLFKSLSLMCSSCDSSQEHENKLNKDRPKLVDPNMFNPFLGFLKSTESVRSVMIGSIRRIFGHIGLRTNNTATVGMHSKCLELIQDPSHTVRLKFSKVITCLIGETSSELNEIMVQKLKEAFSMAKLEHNIQMQETIVATIAQIGRVAEKDLLLVVIISLMESMMSTSSVVAAAAFEQLRALSLFKKSQTHDLFMQARLPVCKFLVEAMLSAQTSSRRSPEEILKDVAIAFNYSDVKMFVLQGAKYMVPHLVSKATKEASDLNKIIATILDVPSRMKLVINNMKHIYSYLVCFCNKNEMERAITFTEHETDVDFGGLLRLAFQDVHSVLLQHLSSHYTQVFSGLRHLAKLDENNKLKEITTSEQMADYLQPRLLGVIRFFDSRLITASVPKEDKIMTLESLASLIRLMGQKHIGPIRHKLVNTLRIGLGYKDHNIMEAACNAWNCFVRSLELSVLGQMISQIIATLLLMLETIPNQVITIFNYIVLENKNELNKHFHEIDFLPDIPELTEINMILKKYTESQSSQSDLKNLLMNAIKGISNDTIDVQRHALMKLKKLLREEKGSFYAYVIGNETADPIISKLVSKLLQGCRETDSKAQCLYAECLGELGAIDPGRLELLTNDPKAEIAKFHKSVTDDNFGIFLINKIINEYLSTVDSTVNDCHAFGLQELLKVYKVADFSDPAKPVYSSVWNRFTEFNQDILKPLFHTKYVKQKQNWSQQKTPIYSTESCQKFQDWVNTWAGYLSSKVKNEEAFAVFAACGPIIKKNYEMSLYLLPYIVLQVILDGDKISVAEVEDEINVILKESKKSDSKSKKSVNFYHLSTQTIFSIIDYLTKWTRHVVQNRLLDIKNKQSPFYAVKAFLAEIPQDLLAEACVNCKAFTRALMHFEQFLSNKEENVQLHLDFMQKLYVAMDEPDGVVGVMAIRKTQASLTEQILAHESLGQHEDAQACYERALQIDGDQVEHHQGLLKNLIELGQQSKAMLHATGAIAEKPAWAINLNSYMVESAWKLGNWPKLEQCIKADKSNRNWNVSVGRLLLKAKDKNEEDFRKQLQVVQRDQLGPLSAASMESGSYHRGYEYIVRLHMLSEMEQSVRILMHMNTDSQDSVSSDFPKPTLEDLLKLWESRLDIMQCSIRMQEPVLSMRRTLLSLAQQTSRLEIDKEMGHLWLSSAKIAQRAGYLQTAYSYLLQAMDYHLPEVFIQRAQFFWDKGEKDQALSCIERGMTEHFSNVNHLKTDQSEEALSKLKVYAQALLLYGCYNEETSSLESNVIIKQYREVTEVYPDWEEGHFHLGKYYDKIMTTFQTDKRPDQPKLGDFTVHVVKSFGQSLKYGNKYIYQSMPRLLSLWLDYGSHIAEMEKNPGPNAPKLQNAREHLSKINRNVATLGKGLAPYQLFTAFSQLVSRICHGHGEVFQILKEIIARLFVQFPQQALWMMMGVSKSSHQTRVLRCKEIFSTAELLNKDLQKFMKDATKLTDRLLELCNKDFKNENTASVSMHFKPLKRLLGDSSFSNIIIPLLSSMTVVLPNTPGSHMNHNPFTQNPVYIHGIEDTVEIFSSLQRPKKITLVGSDGKFYPMMCKPKDDLRKDCRLMEFNGIVNKFLHNDPESRRRQLHIRTYAVVPLNEECGLLEWVNNTSGFRAIITRLLREKGFYTSNQDLKKLMAKRADPIEVKLKIFKERFLPRHPPVFKEWFLIMFPDPTSWYNARLAYARTSAVMSIIGYILGLGDRHGENILFDSTTGDCIHVDLNCLFNRGETFEWPEVVPFRLTPNMLDALGPLQYEGIFKRACEVTLRVMRTQTDPLMSVLKPFIYDPLVEWSRRQKTPNAAEPAEFSVELATKHVQNIEDRLKGILKSKASKQRTVPLSIEGHVNYLLKEATSEINLCQMYVGWTPYM